MNLKAYEEALKAAEAERCSEARSAETVSRDRAADMASRFERGELSQLEEDAETRRRREEDAALFREAGKQRAEIRKPELLHRPAERLTAICRPHASCGLFIPRSVPQRALIKT